MMVIKGDTRSLDNGSYGNAAGLSFAAKVI